jgi:hypothetical protein
LLREHLRGGGGGLHGLEIAAGFLGGVAREEGHVDVEDHRREEVVEIVGDAAGEDAGGLEFAEDELVGGGLFLGGEIADGGDAGGLAFEDTFAAGGLDGDAGAVLAETDRFPFGGGGGVGQRGGELGAELGGNEIEEGFSGELFDRVTERRGEILVGQDDGAAPVDDPTFERGIDEAVEAGLALAEGGGLPGDAGEHVALPPDKGGDREEAEGNINRVGAEVGEADGVRLDGADPTIVEAVEGAVAEERGEGVVEADEGGGIAFADGEAEVVEDVVDEFAAEIVAVGGVFVLEGVGEEEGVAGAVLHGVHGGLGMGERLHRRAPTAVRERD